MGGERIGENQPGAVGPEAGAVVETVDQPLIELNEVDQPLEPAQPAAREPGAVPATSVPHPEQALNGSAPEEAQTPVPEIITHEPKDIAGVVSIQAELEKIFTEGPKN